MGTITLTAISQCGSGNHIKIGITGDFTATVDIHTSEVTEPFTEEEKEIIVKGLLRLAKKSRTLLAQLKTALSTGLQVSA